VSLPGYPRPPFARFLAEIGDPAETRDRETRARIAHRFQYSDRGAIFSVHNYAAVCREMSVKLSNRARLSTSRSLNGNSADLFTRARVLFLANGRADAELLGLRKVNKSR